MMALIRKNFMLWGYSKAFILFFGCLIFSIGERVNGRLTYEQHVLCVLSSHDYLIFLLLPMIIFSAFSFLESDEEYVILRFQSYHAYFFKKWIGVGLISLTLVVSQVLAIVLSAIGLPFGDEWGLASEILFEKNELFQLFQQYFSSPLQASCALIGHHLFGIWLMFGLFMWIRRFMGRKWAVRMILSLYVISALWIKISMLQELPLTGLNHFIIFHHNFIGSNRFLVSFMTMIIIVIMIITSIRLESQHCFSGSKARRGGVSGYYFHQLMTFPNLCISLCVVFVDFAYKGMKYGTSVPAVEWVFHLFEGHGTGYFQMLSFLEMLIINGVPLYILSIFIEQTLGGQSIFVCVRMRSRLQMTKSILYVSIQYLIVYVLFWLIAGFAGAIFLSFKFASHSILTFDFIGILLYAVFMKFLDIFLQYLIILVIYMFVKQMTIGFLTLVGGNMLCMFAVHWAKYLPFGLSSLMRTDIGMDIVQPGVGISPMVALGIEIVILIVLMIYILIFGYKRISN